MEVTKKSQVVRNLMGSEVLKTDQYNFQSYEEAECSNTIPSYPPSSDSPPKNLFCFPPPPLLFSSSRSSTKYSHSEHVESDNSLTTGSASDVEDNSDSQSDVAGLQSSHTVLAHNYGSPFLPNSKKDSGSQSDTGFGGISGSSNAQMRSSPVPIYRPMHSLRGYESDGSPVCVRSQSNLLPPIGVFWDIENCQVPKGRSAVAVAQLIREKFFEGRREAEFIVVCDVKKENAQIISELNDAQVNLIHVSATCKNAADEKLRQSIRRFAEIYGSPAAIILISGDVNFAADLNDLRHRKKIHVILIHNRNTSQTLILCANEHYEFSRLVENLPFREAFKLGNQPVEVIVSNLPVDRDYIKVKNRLKKLSDNCGGRVGNIVNDRAVIRFPSIEFASRAQRRMDGQDVLGNKILVSRPQRIFLNDQESPLKFTPDRSRVRRHSQRTGEDIKISNLPYSQSQDSHSHLAFQHPSTRFPQTSVQGMYFSKSYGNLPKTESPPISIGSTSLASSSASSGPLTSAPFNISQTGIGTANFYRNTPPPRIVLGSVSGMSGIGGAANQPLVNGWNPGTMCSLPLGSSQPQTAETFPTIYATAARSVHQNHQAVVQQKQQHNKQHQISQQLWQGNPSCSVGKPNNTSLQMASQSLSLLTAGLSNSGPAEFNPDMWKHLSEMPNGLLDASNLNWEGGSSGLLASNKSPLRGSTAPHSRTPSPSTLISATQGSSLPSHSRIGIGDGVQWTNHVTSNGGVGSGMKSRTPSPYSLHMDQLYQSQVNRRSRGQTMKTSPVMDIKEGDRFFNPINNAQSRQPSHGSNSGPVELQVTNLDQNMDAKEMKRILLAVFREHVSVLHISVFVQSDGNLAATVKVPSLQDAQYAISQLHRKKVGFKRIQISYSQSGPSMNPSLVRSQIVSLLQDVPGHRLPLFKFREMFENRYLSTISVSDMYKLRDVCLVSEEPNGRMVCLNPQHRNTPSPLLANASSQEGQSAMELPYCAEHYQKPNVQDKGWAEQELATLPNVNVGLKVFTQRVHSLLQTHGGSLPLPSFAHCYGAQCGPLEVDDNGVPLEHLVSCVSGVELYQGVGCVKYLRWASGGDGEAFYDTDGSSVTSNVSPPLAGPLALFSRELVDLLKTAPNCQISFNRFIPAYHHHFGRQCRVADYGYTKLMPLLEALPNIVQVLGEGNKRMVTLSHRAQVRRFTSDLLRVLKAQYSKQVNLSEFSAAYQRVLNRPFEVANYGVCKVEDLLAEVAETTVLVSPIPNSDDVLIAIPKREQTPEEIEKTKQFAREVLQLLRYAPQCSMDFSKFIPYYHHHFGRQCRVSDYGFSKLIELFEAIPDIVKVSEGEEGERRVQLTLGQRLRVLGDIVAAIVEEYGLPYMPISAVAENFLLSSGYALRPEDYGCHSFEELFNAIHFSVKVHATPSGSMLGLVDQDHIHSVRLVVQRILWEHEECEMLISEFESSYREITGGNCNINDLERDLKDIIEVVKDSAGIKSLRLRPLQVFARSVYELLLKFDGKILLSTFESSYVQHYGKAVQPAQYGFSSVTALLQALNIVSLRGKGQRRTVVLEISDEGKFPKLSSLKVWQEVKTESHEFSTPKKTVQAGSESNSRFGESPDTILKKLIRNLSNQPSPAKLPIDIPSCPMDTLPSLLSNGINGAQMPSPPCSRASLPSVQPPHPSELPMPRLALSSPVVSSNADNVDNDENVEEYREGNSVNSVDNVVEASNACIVEEAMASALDGVHNSIQDGSQSASRSKRKQRLAIQFNSPPVPIQ